MSGQPEAITEAELAAAFAERLCRGGGTHLIVADSPGMAAELFEVARSLREPEYEPYEIYEAGDGKRWEFYADEGGEGGEHGWLLPGQVTRYGFSFPARPLRRLVPEGSPLADSERDLIRRDLGRLLDLLGLGGHARPASSHEVFVMCLDEVAGLTGKREETCPGGC